MHEQELEQLEVSRLNNEIRTFFHNKRKFQTHTVEPLVGEPTLEEIAKGTSQFKNNKAPGSDSISAECFKHREDSFLRHFHFSYSGFERKRKYYAVGKSMLSRRFTKEIIYNVKS